MNNLNILIGLENHVELKTKTKLFSKGLVKFGQLPNTNVNIFDIGYPGVLPTVNKKCIELSLIACKLLNMKINNVIKFDRKHYNYPDLPKGFQITQYFNPLGLDGHLIIKDKNNNDLKIDIEKLHIEEDTAKQIHYKDKTFLDFNRSGIGLIEIVTKPVFKNFIEVKNYLNLLKKILIYSDISDARMNEGSLRCDLNISINNNNKVEIKNLNSINNIEKSINYEINRQSKILLNNKYIIQETRRFDENNNKTISMRKKINSIDYKYFTEPNINPIHLDIKWINYIINNINETFIQKKNKFLNNYNLKENDVLILLENYDLVCFFEKVINYNLNFNIIINILIRELSFFLKKNNISIFETKITPINFSKIIDLLISNVISRNQILLFFNYYLLNNDIEPLELVKKLKIKKISDEILIENMIINIIKKNNKILEEYNIKPKKIINFLIGNLMKQTSNQIDIEISKKIIIKIIDKNLNIK